MNKIIKLPENLNGVHIHFVGIKGTGMAALVEIFYHNGAIITGSDVSERFYTDEILEKLNLKALPFSQENITQEIQFVIYSSAYKLDKNPDLIQAVKNNIPCLLYTQALGDYSEKAYSCGVCGVHGKTSTTGLVGTILKYIDLPSQTLVGSVINSFGNTCTYTTKDFSKDLNQHNKIFVAETCEYQRHFMSFCPQKIILTSVESDHQDYYPTYQDIRNAFVDYVCKLPFEGQLIYCADDNGAVEVAEISKQKRPDICLIPYGVKATGDYHLDFGQVSNDMQHFSMQLLGRLSLQVPGEHEVRDALAATALVCELLKKIGKDPKDYSSKIKQGLQEFSGGKRRSEIIGKFTTKNNNSVIVIDDYGHHPTAIKTTLAGYRDFYKNRKIIVDFMSHTYSRTQALLEDFAKSFNNADAVILHKIYASARENIKDFDITGFTLFEKTKQYHSNVSYFEEILDAKSFVMEQLCSPLDDKYSDGYLLVTMGAGDNWKLGKEMISENEKGNL